MELEGKGGKYLEDCSIAERDVAVDNSQGKDHATWAYSPDAEGRLGAKSDGNAKSGGRVTCNLLLRRSNASLFFSLPSAQLLHLYATGALYHTRQGISSKLGENRLGPAMRFESYHYHARDILPFVSKC